MYKHFFVNVFLLTVVYLICDLLAYGFLPYPFTPQIAITFCADYANCSANKAIIIIIIYRIVSCIYELRVLAIYSLSGISIYFVLQFRTSQLITLSRRISAFTNKRYPVIVYYFDYNICKFKRRTFPFAISFLLFSF